jgi:hypothetical protein
MHIKTWHAVLFLSVTSCAAVIAEIPRDTWLSSAALSLALGAAAVAMMGAAALLGGRWKIVESLFGGLDRVYQTHKWLGKNLARQRGAVFIPVSTGPSSLEFIRRFGEIAQNAGPAAVDVSFCGP